MGIEALIKSILSTYHGRYHTVGFSDLRAVSINMIPIYSGVCRSTDSEAMNIVEVIDEVREICGDGVRIYTGNGHTTTRISAGMAYLSHGVIAAGRLYHEPKKNLGARKIRKMVDDLGYLILQNVSQTGVSIDEICQAVERSNHLKKKARIVEGSRTRVEPGEAKLSLKSAELVLCIVGLYHLLKGWKGPVSPINLSDVRLILPA